jgi:ketosteroid isomerase-like protein
MSNNNLERGRRLLEVLSAGDFNELVELTDPEVEWRSFFAELSEGGVYHGHDGMRKYAQDLRDAWELVRVELEDGVAVGDIVLFVGRIRYRGKGSGAEDSTPAGWVLKFRGEKAVSFRAFRDPERVLETAGLSDA